jgi:ribosome-associated protein
MIDAEPDRVNPERRSTPLMDDLTIRGTVVIPRHELQWRFSRSSGPGGQGVNTTDSRAELLFDVARSPSLPEVWRRRAVERLGDRLVDGVLRITASTERSQYLNRRAAEQRLADTLRAATAPPARPRRPTKPSRNAVERRLSAKKRRSEVKRLRQGHED